jgi:hypothetical protein
MCLIEYKIGSYMTIAFKSFTYIQHYVIKFRSDAAGRWFSSVTSTNKTDRHYITEILLKVALNTIPLTLKPYVVIVSVQFY